VTVVFPLNAAVLAPAGGCTLDRMNRWFVIVDAAGSEVVSGETHPVIVTG